MDLHYSQTQLKAGAKESKFESPMDLHYSQTEAHIVITFP